ncbi:hypothetical protein Bca101_068050 [Brassica carinata]
MGKDFKSLVRCMYTGKINDNVRKLKIATEELKDIGNSVMKRVKICEEQQQMKRLDNVQSWLRQADTVIKEAEDLFLMSSSSSQGLLSSSHKMEKKICKKLKEVEEIKSRGMFEVVAENVGGGGSVSAVKTNDEDTVGLEAVSVKAGVPPPDAQNRSKVVFTTCNEEVCKEMSAQTKIKVEKLAWELAWDLFKKNVGEDTVKSHPDIAKVAQEVAAKCDGLPLALVTIGRAMTFKKTPQEWRDALYILSNSPPNFSVLKLLDRN